MLEYANCFIHFTSFDTNMNLRMLRALKKEVFYERSGAKTQLNGAQRLPY